MEAVLANLEARRNPFPLLFLMSELLLVINISVASILVSLNK